MNVVVTIAVGGRLWGDFAVNLGASIKVMRPDARLALIHDGVSIAGLDMAIERLFDYSYQVQDSTFNKAHEHAFYLKTRLYDMCKEIEPRAHAFLFLDADVVMLAGQSVDLWFTELQKQDFATWCDGYYDAPSGENLTRGYTFWCKPQEVCERFNIITLPQINSSFLYWRSNLNAESVFTLAKKVWQMPESELPFERYKDVKPDELCFNIAAGQVRAITNYQYYPVFLQFASETHEPDYIKYNYRAIGFAGTRPHTEMLCKMYNDAVAYCRAEFDIDEPFEYDNSKKGIHDIKPLPIQPVKRRTLYRRGELPGTDGGIFNPDGIVHQGVRYTIYRKEKAYDVRRGYVQGTATPLLHSLDSKGEGLKDLKIHDVFNYNKNTRYEDFRLFEVAGNLFCNFHVVNYDNAGHPTCVPHVGSLKKGSSWIHPNPVLSGFKQWPIKDLRPVEKNWMFFGDGKIGYCVYSLSPYKLIKIMPSGDMELMPVKQPRLDWFHYDAEICNSTNPILVGEHRLMFFHTKENGIYHHGAVLLDAATHEITHYTRNSIPIKNTAYADGIGKGIIYVSGSVLLEPEGLIRVFFGEGDSSACYNDYDKDELINIIKQYPV